MPERRFHARRLIRTAGFVKANPGSTGSTGMLQGFKAMSMGALLLQRSDDTLDHAVLPGTVRRDEFLLQAIATHQGRVAAAGEDWTVIRTQQERRLHTPQYPVTRDQRLLQCRLCGLGLA